MIACHPKRSSSLDEIELLESDSFWSDNDWFHDDPYPTRTLFLNISDAGCIYVASAVSFTIKSLTDNSPSVSEGVSVVFPVYFIPSDDGETLIEVRVNSNGSPYAVAFRPIKIPCSFVPINITTQGKYLWMEFKGDDSSDLVKSICAEASEELNRLHNIQRERNYKHGWIHYRFCEYEKSLLEQKRFVFHHKSYRGDCLKQAAIAFPRILRANP